MNHLEFIFSAVNAIAIEKNEPVTKYWLVEAVRREIEIAKQEPPTQEPRSKVAARGAK